MLMSAGFRRHDHPKSAALKKPQQDPNLPLSPLPQRPRLLVCVSLYSSIPHTGTHWESVFLFFCSVIMSSLGLRSLAPASKVG